MTLAQVLSKHFPSRTRSRGTSYFNQGRVLLDEQTDGVVWGEVEGSSGARYEVTLDLHDAADGVLSAECTCPHFDDGFLCKHLWALILELDDGPESESLLAQSAQGRSQAAGRNGSGAPEAPFRRALEQIEEPSQDAAHWYNRMTQVLSANFEHTEVPHRPPETVQSRIQFLVDVAECIEEEALVVRPMTVMKQARDGSLKATPHSMQEWQIRSMPHQETARSLQLLLDNDVDRLGAKSPYDQRYYGYGAGLQRAKLSPLSYPAVLPWLCRTGRFLWRLHAEQPIEDAVRIRWEEGAPYRLLLKGTDHPDERAWRIEPLLFRKGEAPIDLNQGVALSLPQLVLFADGRMSRADLEEQWGWVDLAHRSGALTVPHDDRERFLEMLYSLPRLPERDLPEELTLPVETATPEPKLRLQGKQNDPTYLQAFIGFTYGDGECGLLDMGECVVGSAGLFRRDYEREQEWIDALPGLGFQPANVHRGSNSPFLLARYRFMEAVETLMQSGWSVEAEDGVIRKPGSCSFSVQTGVDWFDLESEFDFEGASASLPDLLKALHNGEKFIRLDDGTQGLLPKEWLEKFEKLAGLGEVQEDGNVRFKASQAMLLDALLSAQENTTLDQGFLKFRKRLADFKGVQPAGEPPTFQGELRNYQREGLGWLKFLQEFRFGGCLADDMGLGKTIQTLALLEERRRRRLKKGEQRHPSLIVVPKSLVFNWIDEAARFTPKLKALQYHGRDRAALREQFGDCDFVITTYGTLRKDIVDLKDRQFDYVILDESQAIKNSGSQSAKACRLLQAQHRLAMTGTPIENHLGELWSLFEFLNPGLLGHSKAFDRFSRSAPDDVESRRFLQKAIAPYILRRTKQQVLTELPEKTEQTLFCDLPPKQRKEYDQLRDYYRSLLAETIDRQGLKRSKIHVLEALLRLRQAACHPGLIDKKRTGESSAKLETLLEQVTEVVDEGHKVLIFSQFTSLLQILRDQLDRKEIRYEYLTGRTRKRKECVQRFQNDPDCPLFLISLKAGGHGLNLTAAEYVFILDPWWNPAVESQAIDRAHRMGQDNHVFAYRIIARDTVEEKVLELQKQKRELADAIISANDSLVRSLTAEDLQLLLS